MRPTDGSGRGRCRVLLRVVCAGRGAGVRPTYAYLVIDRSLRPRPCQLRMPSIHAMRCDTNPRLFHASRPWMRRRRRSPIIHLTIKGGEREREENRTNRIRPSIRSTASVVFLTPQPSGGFGGGTSCQLYLCMQKRRARPFVVYRTRSVFSNPSQEKDERTTKAIGNQVLRFPLSPLCAWLFISFFTVCVVVVVGIDPVCTDFFSSFSSFFFYSFFRGA